MSLGSNNFVNYINVYYDNLSIAGVMFSLTKQDVTFGGTNTEF
jgi:hypothetical protein